MSGLIYGSFMINEEDIVFSRWTHACILTVECGTNVGGCIYPPTRSGKATGNVRNIFHRDTHHPHNRSWWEGVEASCPIVWHRCATLQCDLVSSGIKQSACFSCHNCLWIFKWFSLSYSVWAGLCFLLCLCNETVITVEPCLSKKNLRNGGHSDKKCLDGWNPWKCWPNAYSKYEYVHVYMYTPPLYFYKSNWHSRNI